MSNSHHVLIPLTIFTPSYQHHNQIARATAGPSLSPVIPSRLRDDLSAYIPACAEQCLFSFVAVNYARGDSTDENLSLEYICAYRGRSGNTVSEGALQCLTGEKAVGFCDSVEAGDASFARAWDICNGQPHVAQPNEGVITATLRFGPQSGVLTFAPITSSSTALPPPPATTSNKSTTTTTTTRTASSTSTSSSIETLSTAPPRTSTPLILTTTSSTSEKSTPTENAPAAATKPLSKGQIAGISIGAACIAAGVAFGVILLVRYLLQRRRRHSGSTIGSFTGGPGGGPDSGTGRAARGGYVTARDTWGYGFDKTTNNSNSNAGSSTEGGSSWIRGQSPGMSRYPAMAAGAMPAPKKYIEGGDNVHGEQHQSYNRNSWRPSAIGLAISPSKHTGKTTPTPTPTRLRPLSKLLPAKPDMPPAPPPKNNASPPPGSTKAAAMQRQTSSSPSHGQQQQQQLQQQPKYEFLHPIAAQFLRPVVPPATIATTATDKSNANTNNYTQQQQQQQQQPASLRLVIPDAKPAPLPATTNNIGNKPLPTNPDPPRDSAFTEFEEDSLRRSTSPAGQIWCPPSAFPPDSAGAVASPYYVADGYGNWILKDTKSVFEKEKQSSMSMGVAAALPPPRIATAEAGIVTAAVRTQIPARRSEEPLQEGNNVVKRGSDELFIQSPKELAARPLLNEIPAPYQQRQQEQKAQPTATAAPVAGTNAPRIEDPKTPQLRQVVATPKTMPSPLFSRQPNPRSVSQTLPYGNNASSNSRSQTARSSRSRITSSDSGITVFSVSSETSDDGGMMVPDGAKATGPPRMKNLSPVAESPRSRAAASSNVGSNSKEAGDSNHPVGARGKATNNDDGATMVSHSAIPGRDAPAVPERTFFPGVVLPPNKSHLFQLQPEGQPSPTLGNMTNSRNGHMDRNNVSNRNNNNYNSNIDNLSQNQGRGYQRQPPYLPYGGYQEQIRHTRAGSGGGGMGRGRGGRGGIMTNMNMHNMYTQPPPHNMYRGSNLRPPQRPYEPRTGSPTMRMVEPSPEPEPQEAAQPYQHYQHHQQQQKQQQQTRDDRSFLPSSSSARRRPPSNLPHPFPMHPQARPHRFAAAATEPQPYLPEPTIPDLGGVGRHHHRDSLSRYPGYPMPIPQPYKPLHAMQSQPQDQDQSQRHSLQGFWRPPRPAPQPPLGTAPYGAKVASASNNNNNGHYQVDEPEEEEEAEDDDDQFSQEAAASTSSSLLAKRLGTTKAANMALPPQIVQPAAHGRWQQTQQQQKQMKSQDTSRQQNYDGQQSITVPDYPVTPDLPSTPTWLPRLTPTRRGTDLVLNVG